jgi:hypothetical protein
VAPTFNPNITGCVNLLYTAGIAKINQLACEISSHVYCEFVEGARAAVTTTAQPTTFQYTTVQPARATTTTTGATTTSTKSTMTLACGNYKVPLYNFKLKKFFKELYCLWLPTIRPTRQLLDSALDSISTSQFFFQELEVSALAAGLEES